MKSRQSSQEMGVGRIAGRKPRGKLVSSTHTMKGEFASKGATTRPGKTKLLMVWHPTINRYLRYVLPTSRYGIQVCHARRITVNSSMVSVVNSPSGSSNRMQSLKTLSSSLRS